MFSAKLRDNGKKHFQLVSLHAPQFQTYWSRFSGPLMDRIDIHIEHIASHHISEAVQYRSLDKRVS